MIAKWCAKYLESRVKGMITNVCLDIFPEDKLVGGWIYGDGWHISFPQDKK